jgi:maltose alpha-D-glucosyltransferase/alpha-amylase
MVKKAPEWLKTAVFYEIYPQSFYDSNGDGIGDIEGIIRKLDYIKDLGFNALWINPCFESPFRDAGYDISDYKKVAPRYGTNADLFRLFKIAHGKGMHVLLDLVPGHTSDEHPWFKEAGKTEDSPYTNRYIWTGHWWKKPEGLGYVAGEAPRGVYIINFFKFQPALNYGFAHPAEKWQLPPEHPDCQATVEAMKDVMRFWMDGQGSGSGCDGFRVDMASSLVKFDDDKKTATSALWRDVRAMLDKDYPEAVIVSEWGNPELSIPAGFHIDFLLNDEDHGKGYVSLLRDYKTDSAYHVIEDNSFFAGKGDISCFLDDYMPRYEKCKETGGYIGLISCNHDTARPALSLNARQLALYYGFLFTMPGTPFLYYGDEIGMRYIPLPSKEGGYFRTGSRTPMQWGRGANAGFSEVAGENLYLPVDKAEDAPNVEAQAADPASLLNRLKALLKLRNREGDLESEPNLEILYAEKKRYPFVWKRGKFVMAVNPSKEKVFVSVPSLPERGDCVYAIGKGSLEGKRLELEALSFCVWKINIL